MERKKEREMRIKDIEEERNKLRRITQNDRKI